MLGLLFDPEDGGDSLFLNVDKFLPDYIPSHPRIYNKIVYFTFMCKKPVLKMTTERNMNHTCTNTLQYNYDNILIQVVRKFPTVYDLFSFSAKLFI